MLRRGKDLVTVILRKNVKDDRGYTHPEEIGRISVLGRFQEVSVSDLADYNRVGEQQVNHLKRFICVKYPGDYLSQILDADGTVWNVLGEPRRFRGSRSTHRDEVVVRQVAAKTGVNT